MNKSKKVYFKDVPSFVAKVINHKKNSTNILMLKEMYSLRKEYFSREEEEAKAIMDTYMYLLINVTNSLSELIVDKSIYLLTNKKVNKEKVKQIINEFILIDQEVNLEKIIETSFKLSKLIKKSKYQYIYLLMLINFLLIHYEFNQIKYLENDFKYLDKYIKEYQKNNKNNLIEFIEYKEKNSRVLPDNYYSNLKEIKLEEIVNYIESNKERYIKKYYIDYLAIFGSFAKGKARIDSDIDLIIKLKNNVSILTRQRIKEDIQQEVYLKFDRLCDVYIIRKEFTDKEVKIFKDNIKII